MRTIYTINTGHKYPAWYVETMAEFLLRFDVQLVSFSDRRPTWRPNHAIYRLCDRWPPGWWGKLKLFKPSLTDHTDVLFVDVDTLFLKDPTPIFTWIDENKPPMAFIKDPVYLNEVGTSMFYLNHRCPEAERVWRSYVSLEEEELNLLQKTKGDQDYITETLNKLSIERVYLPLYFQGQYKALFTDDLDRAYGHLFKFKKLWEDARLQYGPLKVEDFISIHFVANSPATFCRSSSSLMNALNRVKHPCVRWLKEGRRR